MDSEALILDHRTFSDHLQETRLFWFANDELARD